MDLPSIGSQFSPILTEMDPDKLEKIIFRYEKLHTESLLDLTEAAEKLESGPFESFSGVFDSSVSFFTTACSSLLRLITRIALAIIHIIPALFSNRSAAYLESCLYRGVIDFGCVIVGAIGTISPYGGRVFTVKLSEYVISEILKVDINDDLSDSQKLNLISNHIQLLRVGKMRLNIDNLVYLKI